MSGDRLWSLLRQYPHLNLGTALKLSKEPRERTMRLVFPMPINISNGSHGHWRTRHNQKAAYVKALDSLQAAGKIPPPPAVPLDRATVDSVMHLPRQMDVDNAMRRHKWILDWLKTRGYIVDDSPKHLTWVSFPEQRVKRNGEYFVELTLHPLHPVTPQ